MLRCPRPTKGTAENFVVQVIRFRRRATDNLKATIRVLLVIKCVDGVRTFRRFSFCWFGRRGGRDSEWAARELQACRRRSAHVRELNAERRRALAGAQWNGKLEGRNRRKRALRDTYF